MQEMIDRLRAADCETTFVLDGLDFAHSLAGVPPITDPLNRVVYAVHPYSDGDDRDGTWDAAFGDASRRLPGFATNGRRKRADASAWASCRASRSRWTSGFMVRDVPGWTPSNYDDYAPARHLDDAGLLVHALFETGYGRELTDADAVTH